MVGVLEDLGLRGELLGPLPLLLEFLVEGERVVEAADVAAGTRIAVPVPRTADAARGIERSMSYWNQYMIDERALRAVPLTVR